MRKIIKIKEDHYVVVDDSKIEVGDWYIDDSKQIRKSVVSDEVYWQHRQYNREYMKITHSTEPLEDRDNSVISIKPVKSAKTFYVIKPLSLQEVKELLGEVDIEKKIDETLEKLGYDVDGDKTADFVDGYVRGYEQALEDNKEKKYTEDDLWKAVNCAYVNDGTWQECVDFVEEQVLQPKTEWEVEIVDSKLKLN